MFEKLISKDNLILSWRRITTSGNSQYKKFYRDLYSLYEVALEENIRYLQYRLKANTYCPYSSIRTYLPKPSGLQRPITLLHIEDQILLQAFANILINKLRSKRIGVQGKVCFSNYLNPKDSIFSVVPWRVCYKEFQKALVEKYDSGFKWVAHFDLAAFYDTISHELILRQLCPRGEHGGNVRIWQFIKQALATWTSSKETGVFGHGIPQGPAASDLIAEIFLLPVDLYMTNLKHQYYRYVDDIRIFGRDEIEVRKATIDLELFCRERGLIPQSDKHSVKKIKKIKDILGSMPSIGESEKIDDTTSKSLIVKKAEKSFVKALSKDRMEIIDKTLAKYILYRSPRSELILKYVLRLLPHQPEFIDAYMSFLSQYSRLKRVKICCQKLLFNSFPYEYVNGELWRFISKDIHQEYPALKKLALEVVNSKKKQQFSARLGAIIFLCEYEKNGYGNYSEFLRYQESLLQAFAASHIPTDKLLGSPLAHILLKRTDFEASASIVRELMLRNISFAQVQLPINQIAPQTRIIIGKLGLSAVQKLPIIDCIGEILSSKYGINRWDGWKGLFGAEYGHALTLLRNAVAVMRANRTDWLSLTDSFNDTLCRCLLKLLLSNGINGGMNTILSTGILNDYGNLIQPRCQFDKYFPIVTRNLKIIHDRRNKLPTSHPYEKRTGLKNRFLAKSEQKALIVNLVKAYNEIICCCQIYNLC